MQNKQTAILAVSFGTSHLDSLQRSIEAIENDLAAAFPQATLCRAFTSGMICKKLRERDGWVIDSVSQALERLVDAGYRRVVIQPSHVINGEEYEKVLAQAMPFRERLEQLAVGTPLLTALADYFEVARALLSPLPPPQAEIAYLFMGHGTAHLGNPAYTQLEYICHDSGRRDVLVGTVEGYPDVEALLRRLGERPAVKKVVLRPLMMVAGDHAKNDLAGADPASWNSRLTALGYETVCDLRGLGESAAIRAILVRHGKEAAESFGGV